MTQDQSALKGKETLTRPVEEQVRSETVGFPTQDQHTYWYLGRTGAASRLGAKREAGDRGMDFRNSGDGRVKMPPKAQCYNFSFKKKKKKL